MLMLIFRLSAIADAAADAAFALSFDVATMMPLFFKDMLFDMSLLIDAITLYFSPR